MGEGLKSCVHCGATLGLDAVGIACPDCAAWLGFGDSTCAAECSRLASALAAERAVTRRLTDDKDAIVRQRDEALAALTQLHREPFAALRSALAAREARIEELEAGLKEAHYAMQTWFSSEYADHPISHRVGALLARSDRGEGKPSADAFIRLVQKGGAIVSSGDCSEVEIAVAQACGRFFVTDDHMGYVYRPAPRRRSRENQAPLRLRLPAARRPGSRSLPLLARGSPRGAAPGVLPARAGARHRLDGMASAHLRDEGGGAVREMQRWAFGGPTSDTFSCAPIAALVRELTEE